MRSDHAASNSPLILTLEMEEDAFAYFERLRQKYFPPELNQVPAHISLFHQLPCEELSGISTILKNACRRRDVPLIQITGLRNLGRGVAFTAEAPALVRFHEELASHFRSWLTPQDRQRFKPHITVQNRVSPAEARDTLALLAARFSPWRLAARGVSLWQYRQGPWHPIETFPFAQEP